jgi:ferredoxin-NADP reductase
VFPSPLALAIGAVAHLAWFLACEVLAPPVPTLPASRAVASGAPVGKGPADPRRPGAATPAAAAFVSTPVLAVLDETADIKTFRMARPAGFDFAPGQFVPVRVAVDGRPHVRCYSISSAPQTAGYLEISVRRQGLVSTMLHATARTGATITIGRPAGQFTYPSGDDRPLALIAGGIGITPLLSMLRHAVAADPGRPVALLYSARSREALAFRSELHLIAERHPQVRIGVTLSQPGAAPPWRIGRVDAAFVRQYVPHPEHTVFCLCGPAAMMNDLTALLSAEGVPAGQIRFEQFETAVAAAQLQAEPPAAARPSGAGQFQVTFAASGRTAAADASVTLLEAAEREGVRITSSCRAGVCQACRTRLAEGDADCRSSVLDPEDRAAGFILPCVSWATSDCVLEA